MDLRASACRQRLTGTTAGASGAQQERCSLTDEENIVLCTSVAPSLFGINGTCFCIIDTEVSAEVGRDGSLQGVLTFTEGLGTESARHQPPLITLGQPGLQ